MTGQKNVTVYPQIMASLTGVAAMEYHGGELTLIYTDLSTESCKGTLEEYSAHSETAWDAAQFVQDRARSGQ